MVNTDASMAQIFLINIPSLVSITEAQGRPLVYRTSNLAVGISPHTFKKMHPGHSGGNDAYPAVSRH
jgi:hypothetical protein